MECRSMACTATNRRGPVGEHRPVREEGEGAGGAAAGVNRVGSLVECTDSYVTNGSSDSRCGGAVRCRARRVSWREVGEYADHDHRTGGRHGVRTARTGPCVPSHAVVRWSRVRRSEEHTSELQSRGQIVCRLLLEKQKKTHTQRPHTKKTKILQKTRII